MKSHLTRRRFGSILGAGPAAAAGLLHARPAAVQNAAPTAAEVVERFKRKLLDMGLAGDDEAHVKVELRIRGEAEAVDRR